MNLRSCPNFREGAVKNRNLTPRRSLWWTSLACIGALCLAGKSIANPFGEKISSGSATFFREGGNLSIAQGSDKLIIDWKSFSIKAGELTEFIQPGAQSAALNRVYGGNPSEIYGSLRANGKVYLINPNGVFIGPSGRVDAGSFIASTLDVPNDDFLKGGTLSFSGNSEASVLNLGTINAMDGDAFLIAKTVENHGTINAPNGTAGLAGGTEVIIQPAADEKIGVSIASGSGKVINTGKIAAAQAELKAAGGNLYALAIQNTGTVRATGVERKGGRVVLRARNGTIENSGNIQAKNANGTGGRIVAGAESAPNGTPTPDAKVRVVNSGVIDVSGTKAGSISLSADDVSLSATSQLLAIGSLDSGGDVEIAASQGIASSAGSLVDVSGVTGGSALLSAGDLLELSGTVLAEGGAGAGGTLAFHGDRVSTSSAAIDASGATGGTIRITGSNVSVDAATSLTANGADRGGTVYSVAGNSMEFHGRIEARGKGPEGFGGSAEVSGLNVLRFDGTADLRSASGPAGTLTLDPTNFTIDAAAAATIAANLLTSNLVIATSAAGTGAGDIFVNAPVLYSSANTLSLLAHRNILADASIQNSGTGSLNLVAGWDGVTGFGTTAIDFSLFANAPLSYGNNGGSILIGSGTQSTAVAVGSRLGATNAAGFGMTLTGSGRSNTASAQLGFRAEEGVATTIDGAIRVVLKGDLTLTGGEANFSFAQIGHGGRLAAGTAQGAISITTAGDLQITGGVNHSYTQIGHGGDRSIANNAGSITIRADNFNVVGGTKPNAYAQIGHGDGSGDASGVRSGAIDIVAGGEVNLVNGPATNAVWQIGHGTVTPLGITGADVSLSVGALDYSLTDISTGTTLSQDFVDKFGKDLVGGNVTITASGSGGLVVDGAFNYASANRLTLISAGNASVNSSITNGGSGEIALVIDAANPNRPDLNPAATLTIAPTANLSSGGAVRIFAVNPSNTHLGGFAPASQRYNVWYGDAFTVAGVNYKYHPVLTLTAISLTKVYGETVSFGSDAFTYAGLQSGDLLSDILQGDLGISSLGSVATAGVTSSPYAIVFNPSVTAGLGYEIQFINGSLTVTPAPLTLQASDQTKIYGSTFSFSGSEFSATGLKNNESIGLVDFVSVGAAATANVAGSPYAISIANAREGTFNAANYNISYLPGQFSVTPAGLTITANSLSKVYGTATVLSGTEFASSGLLNGDLITSVGLSSVGVPATAGVTGSPYTITASNAVGMGLGNYSITYFPGTLAVTPAPLSLTALDQSKVYGSTFNFSGSEFSVTGLKNNESVGLVTFASAGSAATAGVAGSPYAITISDARGGTFNAANYDISYTAGEFSVTPAGLTITANSLSKEYGTGITFMGTEFSSSGLLNSDLIASVGLSSLGSPATAGVAGSPYSITASSAVGTGLSNYTVTYVPGSLSVTPAPLTLTAFDQSKVYGSTFSFSGTEFSATGLKNNESVGLVSLASAGSAAAADAGGSPYPITISNARGGTFDAANYNISYLSGSLSVKSAALIITANSLTKEYGTQTVFSGTEFASSGLLNGDLISSISLSSLGALATAGVTDSPYTIIGSSAVGSGLGNYAITYLPGALSVTAAPLTLQAFDQSKVYGSTFSFSGSEFSATGLKNNESIGLVNLASGGGAATANVAGSPYTITISNASGGTFNAANYDISYLPGQFSVTPAGLTITANSLSKEYGTGITLAGTEFASSGLLNGDLISSVGLSSLGLAATAGVTGSPYTISASNAVGTGLGNYTITYLSGAVTVTPAPLSLTALDQSKVYGSTFSFNGTEFTATGLKNNESVGLVTFASAGSATTAGVADSPYAITISDARGGTFNAANYDISYLAGEFSVTPAGLTITANSLSKEYGTGTTFTGAEFSSSGLLNGDLISSVGLSSLGSPATAGVAGSPYSITASSAVGTGLGNYTITYLPGSLTVTPAPLSLTAFDQSKVYGSTFSFSGTEFSTAGLKNNESVGLVTFTSAGSAATANVAGSPYAITISNARGGTFDATNYNVSYVAGEFSVTPAGLTITANSLSKEYGTAVTFSPTQFTSSGLLNGDVITGVGLISLGSLATAGVTGSPYTITASNAVGTGLANYTITYLPGSLTVTPAPLSLTSLDQSKIYGNTFNFSGSEFAAIGLKNGESIGLVDLTSAGSAATAGVAAGPYPIAISNAHGGSFNPANYNISYLTGELTVDPARLTITAKDQNKFTGMRFVFDENDFSIRGLQNGETIGSVVLASLGSPASAVPGRYAITPSSASGGTFDAANYRVSYVKGSLQVFARPVPPVPENPPVFQPPLTQAQLQALLAQNDPNGLSPDSPSDQSADTASIISSFGIQRLNVNTFFGEQLVEPGGAMSIDSSGLGPLLPIGEAPPNLEHQLAETPHEVLEAAIAEDDQKYKETGGTRYYELAPDEVFTTDGPGESAFKPLRQSPAALQHAVEGSVEERLLRASQP